jgi:hypothetical protein
MWSWCGCTILAFATEFGNNLLFITVLFLVGSQLQNSSVFCFCTEFVIPYLPIR